MQDITLAVSDENLPLLWRIEMSSQNCDRHVLQKLGISRIKSHVLLTDIGDI